MATPLVIGPEQLERARDIKRHAEKNVMSHQELQNAMKTGYVIGDDPEFAMDIPIGFKVVYTQEDQKPPLNRCHHLSVSLNAPGRAPNEHAVQMIAEMFGIKTNVLKAVVYMEGDAVNVIMPIDESVVEQMRKKHGS